KAECFDTKGLDEAAASYLEEHLPFYEAYLKEKYGTSIDGSIGDTPLKYMVLTIRSIKEVEEFPEYRKARVGAPGFFILFYSKNNEEWVYAWAGNGMGDCDRLDDPDAIKVMHDFPCAGGSGSTTFGEYHNIY
ncbi:MAG: hypothetical protein WDZ42_01355, partial [Candidatus Saccharimonadales bacterium]